MLLWWMIVLFLYVTPTLLIIMYDLNKDNYNEWPKNYYLLVSGNFLPLPPVCLISWLTWSLQHNGVPNLHNQF